MFPQRCNHVKKYFSPFTQPCNYGKKRFLRQMQRCNCAKNDFSPSVQPCNYGKKRFLRQMQPCISIETKIRRKVESNICSDEQKLRAMVCDFTIDKGYPF